MTPDERSLLATFLRDLDGARGGPKDPEADGMIGQALARNPDAAYLLVQHAIVADQSLHAAQARIAELEAQARPANFLPQGNGPWGQAPDRGGYSTGGSGGYAAGGGGGAPAGSGGYGYAPPPPDQRPGIFSGGGGLGSFLRSAGTTAAGVAGGEMLFSGLSNMFGGGGERREGFFGGGDRPEEVVVNNFGDDANDDRDGGDDSDPGNW